MELTPDELCQCGLQASGSCYIFNQGKENEARVILFKTVIICTLIFFHSCPYTCLHWTLVSAFAKLCPPPLLSLHPAPTPPHVVVCGHSLNRLLYPLRGSHVTGRTLAHRHWNYSAIRPYLTSHMTPFLIPRPGSTPAYYKMRVFIWSQTRMLMKSLLLSEDPV